MPDRGAIPLISTSFFIPKGQRKHHLKSNLSHIRNRSRRTFNKPVGKQYKVNNQIRSLEVQVIDHNGDKLGAMPVSEAIAKASEEGLDLVEVSPLAQPPVCKILDYGKFQYQQNRGQQKSKKVGVKGVRLSFKIGQHDLDFKKKQVEKFLDQGHKVKIELRLKGREKAFRTQAKEIITKFMSQLSVSHQADKSIEIQGPTLSILIHKK